MYDSGNSFLNTVIAAPGDDAAKLVYANWLEDNCRPERARLIRDMIAGRRPRGNLAGRRISELPRSMVIDYITGEYAGPRGCTTPCAVVKDGFVVELAATWDQFKKFGSAVCRTNPIRHVHLCRTYTWYERLPDGGRWEIEDLPKELIGAIRTRWTGDQTDEARMRVRVAMSNVLIDLARRDFRNLPVRAKGPVGPAYPCNMCGRPIRGRHIQTISDAWIEACGYGEVPPEEIIHICRQCEKESPEFGGQD
jgi:uncharacterized protein (TIGR02996 family)